MPPSTLSTPNDASETTAKDVPFNLEQCVRQYKSQPDLLELILSSKVEEDRRRAEEAKLKRKQIELLLRDQGEEHRASLSSTFSSSCSLQSHSPPSQRNPQADSVGEVAKKQLYIEPTSPPFVPRKRNSIGELLSLSSVTLPPIRATSPSGVTYDTYAGGADVHARLSYEESHLHSTCSIRGPAPPSPPSESLLLSQKGKVPIPPLNDVLRSNKRRRRNAQAITAIVETRDFPYNDKYLWKNNGNTVRKVSGQKSIYYKCANSSKGCPVNKTVAFKDNGEYLIKYRGEHLGECNRIKHIIDM